MEDRQNYEAYCRGDDDGLARIISDYKDSLIFFLRTFTGDIHTAEDAAEETFVKLAVKKPRYNGKASFKTWLYKIASNTAIDLLRKKRLKTLPLEDAELSSDEADLEESYIRKAKKIAVHRAMRELPEDYQRILWLVYFEGLSLKDAAVLMDRSEHAAQALVSRARQRMKEVLDQKGFKYEEL